MECENMDKSSTGAQMTTTEKAEKSNAEVQMAKAEIADKCNAESNNRETFRMTYSAKQQEEISEIRKKYMPQEPDKMELLRMLDAGVNKKATMVSIMVGVVGTLIMGVGMSVTMSDLGSFFGSYAFLVGVLVGAVGIAILACAYPLYNHTLKKERKKIAPEIIRLTDELL